MRKVSLCLGIFFLCAIPFSYAADPAERVVVKDKFRHDGKPDYWVYSRNGKTYKREWDRNFDGKPDFRVLEEERRLIEKQYDDNFDGRFEKTVKKPEKGSSGRTKTTAY